MTKSWENSQYFMRGQLVVNRDNRDFKKKEKKKKKKSKPRVNDHWQK